LSRARLDGLLPTDKRTNDIRIGGPMVDFRVLVVEQTLLTFRQACHSAGNNPDDVLAYLMGVYIWQQKVEQANKCEGVSTGASPDITHR
jgi:hypothetical protein